jgi:hypothetical protein
MDSTLEPLAKVQLQRTQHTLIHSPFRRKRAVRNKKPGTGVMIG